MLCSGALASHYGVATAVTCAACGLLVELPLTLVYLLPDEGADLPPSMDWPTPEDTADPEWDRGPVMISVEYRVDPAQVSAFAVAMHGLERLRRRDGAYAWGLYEGAATPGLMAETFLLSSWLEHLRQHQRHTHADTPLQAAVRFFHQSEQALVVRHLLAPKAR